MRHYIIGTAGHVDHGKTALVKAITHIDCDTHPEEKKRGITINPGFAYLKQTEDHILAFVDVPGHQRFIHNMIAGAAGVDFVMLVVAADDGIMPQTIEHLKICSLLGIKSGITVINKCDCVAPDYLELCKDEVVHFLKGTFLEQKPIFCVSATKGTGIESLKDYLLKGDFEVVAKERQDFFRMYVDRLFHVTGFGFIATGTAMGNEVKTGDNLMILPGKKKVKVRTIQRHGESVTACAQGSRVALDFVGIKKEDIEVGNIIAQHELPLTPRIDAQLTFMDADNDLTQFEALLFLGTHRCKVSVKVMHAYVQDSQKQSIVQIALEASWYFCINEHFILRNTSNDRTIAGGFVIDPVPLVHKKITPKLISAIWPIIENSAEYLFYKITESIHILDTSYFSSILQLTDDNLMHIVHQSDKIVSIKHHNANILCCRKLYQDCNKTITVHINQHNVDNPLSSSGICKEQIRSLFKNKRIYKDHKSNELALNLFLSQMEKEGILSQSNNRWNMAGYAPVIDQTQQEYIDKAEAFILEHGFEGKYENECLEIPVSILNRLVETATIFRQDNKLFHKDKVSDVKRILYKYLTNHPAGIKVGEFRELLGTNRKTAMSYLDILEREKFICRDGDFRFLTISY